MPSDCFNKYHGRASRDALRAWSGWASTVMYGQATSTQNYGPRYASGSRATYATGRRAALRVGPTGRAARQTNRLLRHRWTNGQADGRR